MIYIFFILLGLMFFLSIYKKNSKAVTIIILIMLYILLINNTYNADYDMYEMYYDKYAVSDKLLDAEPLFQIFCKCTYKLGLNYQSFLCIFYAIVFLLIYLSLRKISNNKALVISCYAIFPLCLDTVQIRHFMAVALLLYGFACLVEDKNNKGEKIYLLFNILAMGFHYSAGFFLPVFLAKKYNYKKFLKPLIIVVVIIYLLILTNTFVKILSIFLPEDKIYFYFISDMWKNNINGVIFFSIVQLVVLFALKLTKFICNVNVKEYGEKYLKVLDYAIFANTLLIYVLPIYIYTTELVRVFRMFIIVDYIAITNILRKKMIKNDIYIYCILICLITFLYYCLVVKVGVYDKTLMSIFVYNNLFK